MPSLEIKTRLKDIKFQRKNVNINDKKYQIHTYQLDFKFHLYSRIMAGHYTDGVYIYSIFIVDMKMPERK